MKLDILMVSIRELSKSFPDWYVERMFKHDDSTCIILVNQNFDKIVANLDSDGRLKNRETIINQRRLINEQVVLNN